MLKVRTRLAKAICAVVVLSFVLVGATQVGAKAVEYFRTYNENKFTGNITAWKSYNETVPENYKIKYSTHNKYSGGWNYWSHEVYFHWTAGGK